MRYVGRHRGPRPLYLRRPVIGGVAAAVLLGGPAFAFSNGWITGLVNKPADGVEASDDPAPSVTSSVAGEVSSPADLPSVEVTTKPTTKKPAAQDDDDGDTGGGYTPPAADDDDDPTTKPTKSTTKPTTTKPKPTTTKPKPSESEEPEPEPSESEEPEPSISISLPGIGN